MAKVLEFKWSVSRARDSYGYNVCTLYADGKKVARCNGGGYDMQGTCLGNYIARGFADRLVALKPEDMPEQGHWERAKEPRRICDNVFGCKWSNAQVEAGQDYSLPHDAMTCPHCGADTRVDHHDGTRVDDGRYFYGLTFHDPHYDPGKAIVGKDCDDRTLGGDGSGATVEQREAEGKSLGLERYQAFYAASSKVPTERHTVPLIDGACGFSEVERIMRAINLTLEYIPTRKRDDRIYQLSDSRSIPE